MIYVYNIEREKLLADEPANKKKSMSKSNWHPLKFHGMRGNV